MSKSSRHTTEQIVNEHRQPDAELDKAILREAARLNFSARRTPSFP